MSYLLDALRKSEAERDRARTPDLSTDHGTARRRTARHPWIPLLIGGALTANAVVLGLWLTTRDGDAPVSAPPSPSAADAPAGGSATALPSASRSASAPETPSPAAAAPAAATEGPTRNASAPTSPARTLPRETAPEPASDPIPEAAPPPSPPIVVDVRDLPSRLRQRVPALEFSTHIYAEEPRYREVGINGRRYAEGTQVAGMRLVEITETGVVFELEGRRFAVSVVDDWDY